MHRRRRRRRNHTNPELDITAFLNLMVILVPFLLITAVFSRITVLDLYLPPASDDQAMTKNPFQLEVVIRKDAITIRERASRLRNRFDIHEGVVDFDALGKFLVMIKDRYPKKTDASILSDPDVQYDLLIQVMDKVRMFEQKTPEGIQLRDLFPNISIGDSPRGKV